MATFSVFPEGVVLAGQFRVVRLLKAGGQGAVYEVVDLKLNRRRAMKVLHPDVISDPDLLARFEREVRVTGPIDCEYLVDVSHCGTLQETGAPYMVMEYLVGKDLSTLIDDAGPVPPDEAVEYLGQVAAALAKTHAAGIVHRDLKPENIFLTRAEDGRPRCKVLDFGIAKLVNQSSAKSTRVVGTPLFMAPEQLRGEAMIGPETDVYSLGLVAFNLLVGAPYFRPEADDLPLAALLVRVLQGLPEPATARAGRLGVALPAAFDAWMSDVCALDPEARPASALEAVRRLAEALRVTRTSGAGPRPTVARRGNRTYKLLPDLFDTADLESDRKPRVSTVPRQALSNATPEAREPRSQTTSVLFATEAVELPRHSGHGSRIALAGGALVAVVAIGWFATRVQPRSDGFPVAAQGPEPVPTVESAMATPVAPQVTVPSNAPSVSAAPSAASVPAVVSTRPARPGTRSSAGPAPSQAMEAPAVVAAPAASSKPATVAPEPARPAGPSFQ